MREDRYGTSRWGSPIEEYNDKMTDPIMAAKIKKKYDAKHRESAATLQLSTAFFASFGRTRSLFYVILFK